MITPYPTNHEGQNMNPDHVIPSDGNGYGSQQDEDSTAEPDKSVEGEEGGGGINLSE